MSTNRFTDPCTQALQTDQRIMEQLYTQPTELNYRDNAIRLLAQGFAEEFSQFAASDERMHELMMELADEFVNKYIPIVDEDTSTDVACELLMSTTVAKV